MSARPEILFLCVHNAGRSQMAAAFARRLGGERLVVHSAGSEPAEALNPAVLEAMAERGLDLSAALPQRLTDEMARCADVIVTMGCGDACPVYPGKRYVDWELTDPAGRSLGEVREIRDQIESRVGELVRELLAGTGGDATGAIEVYADIWCPFAHLGLRWLLRRRHELGRGDTPLRIRAWPLELVNGAPQDAQATSRHVRALRASVAPDLFRGFDPDHFPRSTLGALALAAAAYEHSPQAGETVSLELRDLLFERGVDVADPDVLERVAARHGLAPGPEADRIVLEDWHQGAARGVQGSPHFFCGGRDVFCPALDLTRDETGALEIQARTDRLFEFIDLCLAEESRAKAR